MKVIESVRGTGREMEREKGGEVDGKGCLGTSCVIELKEGGHFSPF